MKKSLFYVVLCALLVGMGFTSCKTPSVQTGVDYTLNVDGDGDGNVSVVFPVGTFAMNGKADLALLVTNDTTLLDTTVVATKAEVLASGDKEQVEALKAVNEFVASQVEAQADTTVAGGTYYFHVKGFVKERVTGLVFAVDREFTNRANTKASARKAAAKETVDEYQYVL